MKLISRSQPPEISKCLVPNMGQPKKLINAGSYNPHNPIQLYISFDPPVIAKNPHFSNPNKEHVPFSLLKCTISHMRYILRVIFPWTSESFFSEPQKTLFNSIISRLPLMRSKLIIKSVEGLAKHAWDTRTEKSPQLPSPPFFVISSHATDILYNLLCVVHEIEPQCLHTHEHVQYRHSHTVTGTVSSD